MGGCQKCGSIGGTRTKSSRESFAHVARENVGTLIVMVQAFTQYAYDLGRVDELFDDNPCGHEMNECQKGLAQFLIPRGNASKLFEVIKEPFDLLP